MTTYTVAQGDCMSSIAAKNGLTWQQLWNDPGNADLRAKRKDPNVLYAGDVVTIPAPKKASVPVKLGTTTTIVRRKAGEQPIRLRVLDGSGSPVAGADYTLTLDGGEQRTGKTDPQGYLSEDVSATIGSATLDVGDLHFDLQIGYLNPLDQTDDQGLSGAQSRLRNLGYSVANVEGKLDDSTKNALSAFQSAEGLDVTGELDDATREKLRARHEC